MGNINDLCYDEGSPSGFTTLPKLRAAEYAERKMKDKLQSVGAIKALVEEQDAYTLHRPVRKHFARNPYTVTNVMDVWECDLLDVQAYAKYNENYKYIISVLDVFSKFLFLVPMKTRSGPELNTAFLSILTMTRKNLCGDLYGYAGIRAKNFSIKTLRTCYAMGAFIFRCAGTQT